MQARRQRGAEHYTIGGYDTGHTVRVRHGWRIARYKLTVTFSNGDRRLMGTAYHLCRTCGAAPLDWNCR